MSWQMVKLGELVSIKGGGTPSKSDSSFWEGNIPWASVKDLKGSEISVTEDSISELGVKNSATNIIPAGTIITATRMALGKFAINTIDMAINQDLKALLVKDTNRVSRDYLFRFLESRAQFIQAEGKGATVKGITLDFLRSIEIPLPPLDEQKRIAAILDKADAIRRKRQQAIQLADDFLRALFLQMFGDPVTNPKGWEVKPLRQLAKVTTGNTPSRMEAKYYGEHIEWIKSDNINTPSHFLTKATEFLSEEGAKVGRIVSKGATLVTCIAGSFECIGNAAYTDRDVAFNQQINALTPLEHMNSWFLYSLVIFSKKHIQSASTNSMKGMVSKGKMEEIPMICPPLSVQERYEKIVHSYLELNEKLNRSVHYSEKKFMSLSQRAFSGHL